MHRRSDQVQACVASQFAYHWLVDAGYTNVRRYSGGLSDWAAAGYELEGEGPADATGGGFFFPPPPDA